MNSLRKYLPAALTGITAVALLEILCRKEVFPPYLVPAPSAVFASYFELSQDYVTALVSTVKSTLWGLGLSLLIGVLLAILFSLNSWLKRAFLPFAVFFQTVPIIAIAPLMVIWFGFGEPTVRASAFIVSLFPILANTLVGLDSADKNLKEVLQFYHARPWQILLKLKIPSAFPYLISGLRIAAGLSVVGAIVGEFVGGGGLGALIDSARTQQRVELVFGAVLLSSLLGLILIGIINFISQMVIRLKPLIESDSL